MSNFPTSVETNSSVSLSVRWKIDRNYKLFDSTSTHRIHVKRLEYSDTFKIENCEWHLCLCKSDSTSPLLIGIDPVLDDNDKEVLPPTIKFSISVLTGYRFYPTTRQHGGGEDTNKMFLKDNVMWRMNDSFTGPFVVIVSFGSTIMQNIGQPDHNLRQESNKQLRLASLGRMLSENIYTDVTINTFDGVKIGVHRAVLASRSPVFHSMFSYGLQEKEHSTINITDMSTKACQVFFKYIYGNMEQEELVEHRLELLRAADKYDIPELKETCVESFSQDIDPKNVVEMLRTAGLFRLSKLKNRCIKFLVKSGNIFEIQDEFKELMQNGDTDLADEIFRQVLKEWKSCREGMDIDCVHVIRKRKSCQL